MYLNYSTLTDVTSTTKTRFLEPVSTGTRSKTKAQSMVSNDGGVHANNLSCGIGALLCRAFFFVAPHLALHAI